MVTMAVLRNRLPEAEIAPKIIEGYKDALRLVKPTGTGLLEDTTAPPSMDGGRPARRAPRLASPGKVGQYPQDGVRQHSPNLGPRGPAFTTPWRPTVYLPVTNIFQAAARNACPGSRQQQSGAAAGSAVTPHQLWERKNQHCAEQAVQVARPDTLPGQYVCFNCRTAGRPYHHPYKACAWTVCANFKWVGHTQKEGTRDFVPE